MIANTVCRTPLGNLLLSCDGNALTAARFIEGEHAHVTANSLPRVLAQATSALAAYFSGGEIDAHLPLAPAGTSFQQQVWAAIARVGRGTTVTYLDIATEIGAPRSVRAVGAATGRNPLCIFIPCHRIVGRGGALTGYAWGLERKRALLSLEARPVARDLVPA